MTKADTSTSKKVSTSTARGRGSYATQACSVCRGKKTKCDGTKPICGPCSASGRRDECSWGKDSGRKPRTEAHFEAMRKRADALEEYVNLLESVLEKCRREHGGVSTDNGQSYLQFRPRNAEGIILPDDPDMDYDYLDDHNGDDSGFSQELCLPTRQLKLGEEGGLFLHGNTAVFRFAPEIPISLPSSHSRFPAGNSQARYVLLVEGADETYYDPDLDWSRYLPSAVPLSRSEHDRILDLLFKFLTSWCLRIVPDLFLRDMFRTISVPRSQTSKTTHYSPMLHNALIAVGTAFSDDPRIRDHKARQCFASTAKSCIEAECQEPNISVMHALSFLGSYHSSLGEQTLGYLYFVGLSIDCSAWVKSGVISEHDMFDRNWAHWTTFTQDVCWSLYVGRDYCVPEPKQIPIPSVDTAFDQIPWHHPPSNIRPQPNFLSTTFAASCELLLIARRIMDVVNGLNSASIRHEVNDQLISSIDLQLNTWKSHLSPDLDITLKSRSTATPHRLMMHCTYWWFFILLHRPFYHRRPRPLHSSDREIDHVKLCKRAAENIVELLGTWRTLYTLRYSPITLVQTAFSAGTIYLLVAVQAATGLRVAQESLKHSLSQAQLCVQYLLEIGQSWHCANNIAEILRNLLQEQLKPLLDRRSIPQAGQLVFTPAATPATGSSTMTFSQRSQQRRRHSQPSSRKASRSRSTDSVHTGTSIPSQQQVHSPQIPSPQTLHQALPSSSSSTPGPLTFDDPWSGSFEYIPSPGTPLSGPLSTPSSSDRQQMHFTFGQHPDGSGMDISSGYLAMLGGEPLSNAPFLPTFSKIDYNINHDENTPGFGNSSLDVHVSNNGPDVEPPVGIPDSELAVLEQFWNQYFR
ncbi:hypothetical protein L208DRAFT_1420221 [Tricholoma matsutake]|nr:hypothetical protein L208DRAFT_1420221 [Tricholoma matsutake 945]